MRKVLLVRFGEVYLKGLNRSSFLKILTDNVKKAVKGTGASGWLADSRIYVAEFEDMDDIVNRVKKVFGLYSVSPAYEVDKDFEEISKACLEVCKDLSGTFKVLARRSDKSFPINSMDMAVELGGRILDANSQLKVDVHKSWPRADCPWAPAARPRCCSPAASILRWRAIRSCAEACACVPFTSCPRPIPANWPGKRWSPWRKCWRRIPAACGCTWYPSPNASWKSTKNARRSWAR